MTATQTHPHPAGWRSQKIKGVRKVFDDLSSESG
jgi:hypothetical protein